LGVPGSGKTIVALEQANRLQLEGVKTLFLSTRTLLTSVQDQISNWDNITVISIEKNSSTNMLSNLKKEHFEFVILDSSEEYLDPQLVEKLDLLLEGGWKDGSWLIMGDLSSSIILADYQISIERIKIFCG
jgi:DNA replication protein DnaC